MNHLVQFGMRRLSIGKNYVWGSSSNAAIAIDGYFSSDKVASPIGTRFASGRAGRGLYNGKDIRTGNNVSFSERKTKRKFKPNVFKKRVYSEILDEMIRFHLTATTLRSIDKAGGLDNYLLTSKHVTSGEGLVAKERILQKIRTEEQAQKNREYQNMKLMEKLQS